MHYEVLTDRARELFPSLAEFEGFYLAGGTGLALQLGHRVSVNFNLFTAGTIKRTLLDKAGKAFKPSTPIAPLVNGPDELTILVDGVKVTFLSYPFPTLDPFVTYERVPILSIREIAATKAYTIGRRGSFKDYVDLYFVLREGHTTLGEIMKLASEKYGDAFNSRLFLEQIVTLDDLQDREIEFLGKSINEEELRTYFEKCITDYTRGV